MDKLKIGIIVNTHGLKGELKVKSFSEFNDVRFKKGKTLLLLSKDEYIEMKIASMKEYKGNILLTFEEMNSINDVEKYRGCEIYIEKSEIHNLEEDEVYYFDLMQCSVYDEDNNLIGEVEDVIETGANAVLRVNKKILIPYVKSFVKESDIKNKKIIIYKVEGLL